MLRELVEQLPRYKRSQESPPTPMPVERQTPDAGGPARGLHVPKSNDSPGTQFDSSCVEQEDEASRRGAEPSLEGGRPNNSHESEPQDAVGETPDATEIPLQNLQTTTSSHLRSYSTAAYKANPSACF